MVMGLCWYVLYTKPNAEYRVARELERKGVETFLPLVKTVNPRRGYNSAPLFPSYVFVRVDFAQLDMRLLRHTPGVRTLVQFDNRPAVVPDEAIAFIRERVEAINNVGGIPPHDFKPGDKVYISSGPLAGLEAIFEGPLGPAKRVWVLIQFLGQINRAQVPVELLKRIPTMPAVLVGPERKVKRPRRTRGKGRRIRNVSRQEGLT